MNVSFPATSAAFGFAPLRRAANIVVDDAYRLVRGGSDTVTGTAGGEVYGWAQQDPERRPGAAPVAVMPPGYYPFYAAHRLPAHGASHVAPGYYPVPGHPRM